MFSTDNLQIPEDLRALPVNGSAIEGYPHIIDKLDLFWGYPEFIDYINDIIMTSKARQGFGKEAIEDLMFLHGLYMDQMHTINRMKLTDSQMIDLNQTLGNNDIWGANHGR